MGQTYRVGEFARLTGVTPRALHHYERVGLLEPARTDAGYRVYSPSDLSILEQIVALRFLGFRLDQIKSLLRSDPRQLAKVFQAQRWLLEERARRIAIAIRAIDEAGQSFSEETQADVTRLAKIVEVFDMKNHVAEAAQYAALLDAKMDRLRAMPADVKADLQRQWTTLIHDIQGALGADPASEQAQALATRWLNLLSEFNGGAPVDPSLAKFAATQRRSSQWPSGTSAGSDAVWAFMEKAIAAR